MWSCTHLCGRRERELTPFEWKNLVKNSLEYSTLLLRHSFFVFFVNSYISILQSVLRAQFYHWMTESHCLLPGEFCEWAAWNFLYKTWMADRLSRKDGKENHFSIFNWDVLNKMWKLNFYTLCICCLRLQWLPKVKGQLSFTVQWRSVTVGFCSLPCLALFRC